MKSDLAMAKFFSNTDIKNVFFLSKSSFTKTRVQKQCSIGKYVSLVDFLLAPRKDHRGWNTPNEASRILLILVLVVVSYWAWPISGGMF